MDINIGDACQETENGAVYRRRFQVRVPGSLCNSVSLTDALYQDCWRISVSCAPESIGPTRDHRAISVLPSIGELSLVLHPRIVSGVLTSQCR